jgi:hypothetical protein
MNLEKRQARARRRAKTLRIVRQFNIPFYRSKWTLWTDWKGGGLTPGEVQSVRKQARREQVTL